MAERGNQADQLGLIPEIVRGVTRSVSRRPSSVLWLVALSVVFSLGVAARFLTFKTDRSDLIDSSAEFQQRWLRYTEAFGERSDIVVVVEAGQTNTIRSVLDDLGPRIEQEDHLFDAVRYRVAFETLRSKGLQFLSPRELEASLASLERHNAVLDGNWSTAGLRETSARLTRDLGSDDLQRQSVATQQAQRLIDSLHNSLLGDPFLTPWLPILVGAEDLETADFEPVYQINETGTMGFLSAIPVQHDADFQGTSQPIDRMREIISDVQSRHPDAQIGLTGIPVLESDEMRRSQSDMTVASVISFLGVGLLLIVGFRGLRHPLLAMVMLAVGLAWSLAYATLFVGHLNILSVSFTAILVGLGIDFAIHYLAKYLELRHHDVALRPALLKTSWGVGTGIVTAAVTTALAFFCATLTNFLGVAELGVIAGGGILLCCVSTFVVLPALISVADRNVEPRRLPTPFQGLQLRMLITRSPGMVSGVSLGIILLIGLGCLSFRRDGSPFRVRYDSNLLNLQAEGVDSVRVQQRVFRESQGSLLYAVSLADTPQEVLRLRNEFDDLPTVGRVEELASRMPRFPAQETRLLVQGIHAKLSRLSDFPRQFPQLNPESIGLELEALYDALRANDAPIARAAASQLDAVLDLLTAESLESQVKQLAEYQYGMLAALKGELESVSALSDPAPVTPNDFPAAIRERFVSEDGQWLLRIFPAEQIWDEAPLERFVADVRTVDPEVTGTPLQNFEAARQIRSSYIKAATYALAVIWLVLLVDTVRRGPLLIGLIAPLALVGLATFLIPDPQGLLTSQQWLWLYLGMVTAASAVFDFSNVRNTFLTLLPPLGGGLLMFGMLGLFQIDLNPANLIVLPLILGIGVDDGVHVIHDFRLQRGPYQTSPSTFNAIMLTSLTSMIGFGSMLVAAHRGLASLGLVLVIGVGSCLFVSLVTLPAILTLIGQREAGGAGESAIDDQDAETSISVPFEGANAAS